MTGKEREGSDHAGRFGTTRVRMMAVGVMAGIGGLALTGTTGYVGISAVLADRAAVDRSYQALETLSRLRGQLHDAQRGEQSFLLTADEHYLQSYTTAADEVPRTLAELRTLMSADAARRQMTDDLQVSAVATLDYLGQVVTLLRTDGFRAARPAVLGTVGTKRWHAPISRSTRYARTSRRSCTPSNGRRRTRKSRRSK